MAYKKYGRMTSEYKCRRCGEVITHLAVGKESALARLEAIPNGEKHEYGNSGWGDFKMFIVHKECSDDGLGLCDWIGFCDD